jgi:hypothetical protein
MRAILLGIILFSFTALRAQTFLPVGLGYMPAQPFANNIAANDSLSQKKWSVSKFVGISQSFIFSKDGNASISSVPIGLQVNRRLNNNLYAFANVAIAASYINFNHAFTNSTFNKMSPGSMYSGSNSLGIYSSASMGLMYINDARTFSISGSISVERNSTPFFPVYLLMLQDQSL